MTGAPRARRRARHDLGPLLLLAPALALIAALMALPLGLLVLQSLRPASGGGMSLAAYASLAGAEGDLYRMLLVRSLGIALAAAALVALVAFPVAWFLAFRVRRSALTWLLVVTLPFWISYLLRILSWKILLGYGGALNSGLIAAGVISAPIEALLYNRFAVLVTLAHSWSAFAVLPIYVALQKIDPTLIEAAADLGEPPYQCLRRVVVPLAMPGIVAAFLLVFVPTMGDYITPALVGGTDGVMVGGAIATLFGRQNDPALGAALSVVTMGAVAVVAAGLVTGLRGCGLWRRLS